MGCVNSSLENEQGSFRGSQVSEADSTTSLVTANALPPPPSPINTRLSTTIREARTRIGSEAPILDNSLGRQHKRNNKTLGGRKRNTLEKKGSLTKEALQAFPEESQFSVSAELDQALRSNIIFADASDEERESAGVLFKRLELNALSCLLRQDDESDDRLYILASGEAVMSAKDSRGFIVELKTLSPGEHFHEASLFDKNSRRSTNATNVSSLTPCVFYYFERKSIKQLRKSQPNLVARMLGRAAEAYLADDSLERISAFKHMSSQRRYIMRDLFTMARHVKGSMVVEEGASQLLGNGNSKFHIIVSGNVRVTREGQFLRSLGPGDYFGEASITTSTPPSATIYVEEDEDLLVLEMDKKDFVRVVNEEDSVLAEFAIRAAGIHTNLHDVLHHEEARGFLVTYAAKEYSHENVDFLLAVDQLESLRDSLTRRIVLKSLGINPENVKALKHEVVRDFCTGIYNTYLGPDATHPINVPHSITAGITSRIEAGTFDIEMFAAARQCVFDLLDRDSFARFLRSDDFKELLVTLDAYELNRVDTASLPRKKNKSGRVHRSTLKLLGH